MQRHCPNKEGGPCNWRDPNKNYITTAAEAQELAQLDFAVCPINSDVV